MRKLDYKVQTKGFTGSIIIREPTNIERTQYLVDSGIEFDESSAKGDAVKMNSKANLNALMFSLRASEKHYESVDVKHDESGDVFKSFEDLNDDSRTAAVMYEVARVVMHGFVPSKNSKG